MWLSLNFQVLLLCVAYLSLYIFCIFRLLVRKARKIAVQYEFTYHESIPVSQLVQKVAAVMQEYTQSG